MIDDVRHIDTDPRPVFFGGGYYAPFQTIGAELQLDGSKSHRLSVQHLGVAGTASPGVQDSPLADYLHSLYVDCPGFLVLTNHPAIPPQNYIYQASGAVGYDWVGGDGAYGDASELRLGIAAMGRRHVLDVHENQLAYLEHPRPHIPDGPTGRGGKRNTYRSDKQEVAVKDLLPGLPQGQWTPHTHRQGTKGGKPGRPSA